jgi:hypothetical protein
MPSTPSHWSAKWPAWRTTPSDLQTLLITLRDEVARSAASQVIQEGTLYRRHDEVHFKGAEDISDLAQDGFGDFRYLSYSIAAKGAELSLYLARTDDPTMPLGIEQGLLVVVEGDPLQTRSIFRQARRSVAQQAPRWWLLGPSVVEMDIAGAIPRRLPWPRRNLVPRSITRFVLWIAAVIAATTLGLLGWEAGANPGLGADQTTFVVALTGFVISALGLLRWAFPPVEVTPQSLYRWRRVRRGIALVVPAVGAAELVIKALCKS